MKSKVIQCIFIVIGLLLIAYPIISDYIASYNQTIVISDYQEKIKNMSEEEKREKLNLAHKYNEELESETTIDISLSDNKQNEQLYESYLNILNIGKAMAYINIPKIGVYLPIYHGVSNDVLQSGIGHIDNTSLPVGGKGTHCVLAGHTGLASQKIFDNLDKLELGDVFYIYVLGATLQYEVDNIKVVNPSNTDAIEFNKEKDFVTLVTCTPYLINSHRLLVRGTRVLNTQNNSQDMNNIDDTNTTTNENNLDNFKDDNTMNIKDNNINIQKLRGKLLRNIIIAFIMLLIIIIVSIKYIFKRKDNQN